MSYTVSSMSRTVKFFNFMDYDADTFIGQVMP